LGDDILKTKKNLRRRAPKRKYQKKKRSTSAKEPVPTHHQNLRRHRPGEPSSLVERGEIRAKTKLLTNVKKKNQRTKHEQEAGIGRKNKGENGGSWHKKPRGENRTRTGQKGTFLGRLGGGGGGSVAGGAATRGDKDKTDMKQEGARGNWEKKPDPTQQRGCVDA